jgi:hypothetical protein
MLQIDVPAVDRSLLTIEELRAAAGVADASRDTELQVVGDAVSDLIADACQVTRVADIPPTLRAEAVTETFELCGRWDGRFGLVPGEQPGALRPSRRPIASITTVTEAGTPLGTSDYQLDGAAIYRLQAGRRMHWHHGPIAVSYVAGWADVPAGLKWAARKFVQAVLLDDGRDPMLKRKVTIGVSEYEWWVDPTKDSIVPAEVMDVLLRGGYVNRWGWLR